MPLPIIDPPTSVGSLPLERPLCIGTMQWGTSRLDNLVNSKGLVPHSKLLGAAISCSENGITFFDSAEGYGGGSSEECVHDVFEEVLDINDNEREKRGGASNDNESADPSSSASWNPVLATKFLPAPWRFTRWQFMRAVRNSRSRVNHGDERAAGDGEKPIPLLFIHTPTHWLPLEYFMEYAFDAVDEGLVTEVGISNFSTEQVARAQAVAERRGKKIAAHQMLFSLLSYRSEKLQRCVSLCHSLGIAVIGFSPLGQGLLCDSLTESRVSEIRAAKMSRLKYEDLTQLRSVIGVISKRRGKTMGQVAVNWSMRHGVIPLVGCKSKEHVDEAAGALGWSLNDDEVAQLDGVALGRSTLESPKWRRGLFMGLLSTVIVMYYLERWFLPKKHIAEIKDKKRK